jgi:predicted alpha/beta-hydrolase family hydrolase
LFVHGSADPFGTLDEVRAAVALIPSRTGLLAIPGAGHDLKRAPAAFPGLLSRLRALMLA